MQKHMRATNKGETHCCSIKDIKKFFGNTLANVSFDFAERGFDPYEFRIEKYVNKKIKGKIVCDLHTCTRDAEPWLSCNVIKEKDYSEDLRKKFVAECLPELHKFYEKHHNDTTLMRKEVLMLIELFENKFIMHEVVTPRNIRQDF